MNPRRDTWRWGLALLLAGATRPAGTAGSIAFGSPAYLPLQIADPYLQTDLEFQSETQRLEADGVSLTRTRLLVQPVLGFGLIGSIYHPNLVEYHLNPELGLDWQSSREQPGGAASDLRFLQRYHGTIDILRAKPYALSLYGDKDLTARDYDFFTRVRVDSERYGARAGLQAGPVPFSAAVEHFEETTADLSRPTHITDDTLSVGAENRRRNGMASTTLSYNVDRYTRQDDGFSVQSGVHHSLTLFDHEAFGADNRLQLGTSVNYNSVTETPAPTGNLLLQEHLQFQHSASLRSFGEYSFDHATATPSVADTHLARLGLSHQLYDNLVSTLDVHGTRTDAASPDDRARTERNGVSLAEEYTRPLGTWGQVTLGYAGTLDHEERTSSGHVLTVIDEIHTLTSSTLTFLNRPAVVPGTVHVTDRSGTIEYFEGADYLLIPHDLLVEIRRVIGGQIPDGSVVRVDYASLLQPSAAYYAWNNSVHFRFDLAQGRLGLYGRWTTLDYSGGEQLLLRWMDDRVVGVDSSWRWLRVGAEYEEVASNLAPFDRARLFQSLQFQAADGTSLGLDADQSWTRFHDNGLRQSSCGVMLRCRQRLAVNLTWDNEGGVRFDRGDSFDRDVGVVRTGLDWSIGRLNLKVGYEYDTESHPTDLRDRHYFFLRARRSF